MSMKGITGAEVLKTILLGIVINGIFAAFLYLWASNSDFTGLGGQGFGRYLALFYFGVTTFTTTGYGDIVPKSNSARIATVLYMLAIFAGIISFLFDF